MANGQQADFGQGSLSGGNLTVRLRSRKTGSGTAEFALTGSAITAVQGSFTLRNSKALTGSSITSAQQNIPAGDVEGMTWDESIAYLSSRGTLVRSWDFSSEDQLGRTFAEGGFGDNFGIAEDAGTVNLPEIDLTKPGHSGGGALKFTVPGLSSDNAAGEWYANFSSDLLTRFGANTEFWITWKQQVNEGMITELTATGQSGIKTLILGHQDGTGAGPGGAGTVANSSDWMKLVVQGFERSRFPILYRYKPTDGSTGNLFEGVGSDIALQNAMPSPFCRFNSYSAGNELGCHHFSQDEYEVYTLHVTLGEADSTTYTEDSWANSEAHLYVQTPGGERQHVISYTPSTNGYLPLTKGPHDWQFGKLWFGPFMTSKNASIDHDDMILWITDVMVTTEEPPLALVEFEQHSTLSSLSANTAVDLGVYTCTDMTGEGAGTCQSVTDYSGMVYDAGRHQMLTFGGGHASTNNDGLHAMSLEVGSSLQFVAEFVPTPASSILPSNADFNKGAWLSGTSGPYPRPMARHTLDSMSVVGQELIVLAGVEGNAPAGISGVSAWEVATGHGYSSFELPQLIDAANGSNQGPYQPHYDLEEGTFTFSSAPGSSGYGSTEYDELSGKIVILQDTRLATYDPITKIRTTQVQFTAVSGADQIVDESDTPVSSALVDINGSMSYRTVDQYHYHFSPLGHVFRVELNRSNLSESIVRKLTTTGSAPAGAGDNWKFVYDEENDLFIGKVTSNVVYAFNPSTKAWSSQTISGSTPGTQAFHALDYDPINKVVIFITTARRVWAYKWA
jgi:hypothetical protein